MATDQADVLTDAQRDQLRQINHMGNGQAAYEAYCHMADGKSLVSGAPLPGWDSLNQKIRDAWFCAAAAVCGKVLAVVRPAGPPTPMYTDRRGTALALHDVVYFFTHGTQITGIIVELGAPVESTPIMVSWLDSQGVRHVEECHGQELMKWEPTPSFVEPRKQAAAEQDSNYFVINGRRHPLSRSPKVMSYRELVEMAGMEWDAVEKAWPLMRYMCVNGREDYLDGKTRISVLVSPGMVFWVTLAEAMHTQTVMINGCRHRVAPDIKTLTYEDLVSMAGMTGTPSMTYRYATSGAHNYPSGILHPGEDVRVDIHPIISVTHTGNA